MHTDQQLSVLKYFSFNHPEAMVTSYSMHLALVPSDPYILWLLDHVIHIAELSQMMFYFDMLIKGYIVAWG